MATSCRALATRSQLLDEGPAGNRLGRPGGPHLLDGYDGVGGVALYGYEPVSGKSIDEQLASDDGVQPSEFHRVDSLVDSWTEDEVPVAGGRGWKHPGHRTRAFPREPVIGRACRVDGPHVRPVICCCRRNVRNELADRWILREVEHLSVRREHPLVIPDHRTRRRRHRRNALDLADTRCLRHVSAQSMSA